MLEVCFDHIRFMLCSGSSPTHGSRRSSAHSIDRQASNPSSQSEPQSHVSPKSDTLLYEQLPMSDLFAQLGMLEVIPMSFNIINHSFLLVSVFQVLLSF